MPFRLAIPPLPLPTTLPSTEAMASCGQSTYTYEPEFWEFEYRVQPYLRNLEMRSLFKRYADIARNLSYIASSDRDVIPVNSFLSSWYWYKKEFQTRLELFTRGQATPVALPFPPRYEKFKGPTRPERPNSTDVLYRYSSKRWINKLVTAGSIRMWRADKYAQLEKDPARQDVELVKTQFLYGPTTHITTTDGHRMRIKGDVKVEHEGPTYYVLCLSCEWDPRLFSDFKCDHCAEITDVEKFSRSLENASTKLVPGWVFGGVPVQYFDPYVPTKNQHISNAICKDFRFAYQREYRFALMYVHKGPEPAEYLDVRLGSTEHYINTRCQAR